MNTPRSKAWLVVLLLVAVAAALLLRIALFKASVAGIPAFDDECKIAIQAKQITRGHTPLLILASPYIFPLEAYLMAPFIHALPRDAFGARIMAFGFGLLTVIASVILLRRWGRLRDVWPGLLLVLVPSAYLMTLQSACALPAYPTMLLAAPLALWLAERAAARPPRAWLLAGAAGLVSGLACSESLVSAPTLLMAGLVIAGAGWRSALALVPAFGLGALAGFAPHLAAKILLPGAFSAVEQSMPWREAVGRLASPAMDPALPAAFGIGCPLYPDTGERIAWLKALTPAFGWAWLAFLVAVTLLALIRFFQRSWRARWPSLDGGLAAAGISWLCLVLYLISHRSHSSTYRYFFLAVWSFPLLLAYAYRESGRTVRWLLGTVAVLLVAANVVAALTLAHRWSRPGFAHDLKSYDLTPTFDYLASKGITRCYATYVDAYRITFESDEKVVCAQPYNERFAGWPVPFKADIVDPATNVAFVLSDAYKFPPEEFEKDLAAMNVGYQCRTCGAYRVYTDFVEAVPQAERPLPSASIQASTSHYPPEQAALTDGVYATRWRSRHAQEQGLWIELRLPAPAAVCRLSMYYTGYRFDRARSLRLLWHDGREWQTLLDPAPGDLDCFEFEAGHPVYGNELKTFRFPAVTTDRLRIEIVEPNPGRDWTVGEIRLFGPG